MFAVYCDMVRATDIKIHKTKCGHYKNREKSARTSIWKKASDAKTAKSIASTLASEYNLRYRNAKCCLNK